MKKKSPNRTICQGFLSSGFQKKKNLFKRTASFNLFVLLELKKTKECPLPLGLRDATSQWFCSRYIVLRILIYSYITRYELDPQMIGAGSSPNSPGSTTLAKSTFDKVFLYPIYFLLFIQKTRQKKHRPFHRTCWILKPTSRTRGSTEWPKYSLMPLQLRRSPKKRPKRAQKVGWAGALNPCGKLWPNWLSGLASHLQLKKVFIHLVHD